MLKTIPELIALARENITTLVAKDALEKCNQCNGILIDVREPSEFNEKAVPGAINIPRGVLEMQMVNRYPSAHTDIFIHCATSGRAILAAEQLQRLGYTNVNVISCPFDNLYSEYISIHA
ncbi:rhodanese-like domain-containing protein [Colwelliaceae bacterium 6471]